MNSYYDKPTGIDAIEAKPRGTRKYYNCKMHFEFVQYYPFASMNT